MPTPEDLERFVMAQAPIIDDVRRELRDGRKRSHWMWFIFPQIYGLTLFASVPGAPKIFSTVLNHCYDGIPDRQTLEHLGLHERRGSFTRRIGRNQRPSFCRQTANSTRLVSSVGG